MRESDPHHPVLAVGALFLAIFLHAGEGLADTLERRIASPYGYHRIETAPGGFGEWLRRLPLLPGRPPVLLFDGRQKANQDAHYAVVDLDVGTRNLQQCADAVIRLRAEYLRSAGCEDRIVFDFTSGDAAAWTAWRKGMRPEIRGNEVTWRPGAPPDAGAASFRRYLDLVFTYVGTASLIRELVKVEDPSRVEPTDLESNSPRGRRGDSFGSPIRHSPGCSGSGNPRIFHSSVRRRAGNLRLAVRHGA